MSYYLYDARNIKKVASNLDRNKKFKLGNASKNQEMVFKMGISEHHSSLGPTPYRQQEEP